MEHINLTKLVGEIIHSPRVDGYPLYQRVGDVELNRSPKWHKEVKKINNSPSNVRKLFITYEAVYVEYYVYLQRGKRFRKQYKTDLLTEIAGNSTFTGHILKALESEWVLSNLEEIYFDWSVLLGTGPIDRDEFLNYIESGAPLHDLNPPYLDVDKYNRLHVVGYIPRLEKILIEYREAHSLDSLPPFEVINKLETYKHILKVKDDISTVGYTCKEGIYTFDLERLKPKFDHLIRKQNEAKSKAEQQAKVEVSSEDRELNTLITEIIQSIDKFKLNKEFIVKYLLSLFVGVDKSDIEKVLNQLINKSETEELKEILRQIKSEVVK